MVLLVENTGLNSPFYYSIFIAMTKRMNMSSNRSIVNCGLTSAHDTCTLSLSSSTEEIKRYFKAILELSKLDVPYPVNLDYVWMLAYSRKDKAVTALKENFIESIGAKFSTKKGKTPKEADQQ